MPSDLNRFERLQIMLSPEELSAVDDWRFAQRMPSRAAAIRELIRLGLASTGERPSEQRQKSSDYGVLQSEAAKPARARRI
jgi:hypothetical protein